MPRLKISPTDTHIVYCDNEEDLFNVIQLFEEFLMKKGIRPFVKIGSTYFENYSFDFRITEHDYKSMIYQYFDIDPTPYSKYRVFLMKNNKIHHYPFNQIQSALLLCKVLEREVEENTRIELMEYAPHIKGEWKIWKDRKGKTAREIPFYIQNEEIMIHSDEKGVSNY